MTPLSPITTAPEVKAQKMLCHPRLPSDVNFVDPCQRLILARRAYESFHQLPRGASSEHQVVNSSAGFEGWWKFAQVFKSRRTAREDVVRSGVMKGMICSSPHEARMVEKLSDLNAGFSEQVVCSEPNTMCLCEGYGQSPEILVSDADWIEVDLRLHSTVEPPTMYAIRETSQAT